MTAPPAGRAVRGEDAERIRDLVDRLFETYVAFAPAGWTRPAHPKSPLPELAARIEAGRGWILEQDGRSLAQVLWTASANSRLEDPEPDLAYLWQLFVDVALQGTGVAARLHSWAIEDARDAGFERMRLLTPSLNARARRFYEREGWTEAGPGGWDDTLDLELTVYDRRLTGPIGENAG